MTQITLPRATVEQALEALEMCRLNGSQYLYGNERDLVFSAIKAFRAALAQQAEPAYWEVRCTAHPKWMRVDEQQFDEYVAHGWEGQKLYTAPPKAEPVGRCEDCGMKYCECGERR